jgi:addiction module HigA family antidote
MAMKNPTHAGGVVLRQYIEPLGLTITDSAVALGVTRTTLSELVNGKRGISPEMAVRLSKVFGGSAESWLTQQAQYGLAQVQVERTKLRRLVLPKLPQVCCGKAKEGRSCLCSA